jgi:hypothetical protein
MIILLENKVQKKNPWTTVRRSNRRMKKISQLGISNFYSSLIIISDQMKRMVSASIFHALKGSSYKVLIGKPERKTALET